MTSCTNGPNGAKCVTCEAWDSAMGMVLLAEQERAIEAVQRTAFFDYHREMRQIWKERDAELVGAINTLRNVLGRTIERRIDLETGKPFTFLGEERSKALALAGEVMK